MFNIKDSLHRKFLTYWLLISDAFTASWMWLPCVVAVLGFWKTLLGVFVACAAATVCMLCLLVVRRRRALALQGWRRGFLSLKGYSSPYHAYNQSLYNQTHGAVSDQSSSSSSYDYVGGGGGGGGGDYSSGGTTATTTTTKTRNPNAVTFGSSMGEIDENNICLSDLEPGPKQWPEGATRMFEGSAVFHCDMTIDSLWNFCFAAPSSSFSSLLVQKGKNVNNSANANANQNNINNASAALTSGGSNSKNSYNTGTSTSSAALLQTKKFEDRRFIAPNFFENPKKASILFLRQFFETLLTDVGTFTSLMYDSFQTFSTLSILSLIFVSSADFFSTSSPTAVDDASMKMMMNNNNQQNHSQNLHATTLSRYFATWSQIIFSLLVLGFFYFLSVRFDVRKLRMWWVASILVLATIVGVKERFLASSQQTHFPSKEEVFEMFYAEPHTRFEKNLDVIESKHFALLMMAKRPLANPSACLLTKEQQERRYNETMAKFLQQNPGASSSSSAASAPHFDNYVPYVREFIIFMICTFFSLFTEVAGVKSQPFPEPVDPTELFASSSSMLAAAVQQQQQQLDTAAIADDSSRIESQQQQQQQGSYAILLRDSVAFFAADYTTIVRLRAFVLIAFSVLATWISPMMSWEMSFSSWIGVVFMKATKVKNASVSSLLFSGNNSNALFDVFDFLLVAVFVSFTSFCFVALTIPKILARLSNKRSFYCKVPELKTVAVVVVALLIAAQHQTHMMSTAMKHGAGERSVDEEEQIMHEFETQTSHTWLASAAHLVAFGWNPWQILSKCHYLCTGLKSVALPLFMFSESEEALYRLGFPRSMVSVHSAWILDRGRARIIGICWACFWAFFVYQYC